MDFIVKQGPLPTDQHGVILDSDDVLRWYGLDKFLTVEEARHVRFELSAMIETQTLLERARLQQWQP
jgi:hypothetical protein